jgi:hypothetical protein
MFIHVVRSGPRWALTPFLLVAVAVSACDDDGGGDPLAGYRQDCVERINDFRATIDLPPLARWQDAEQCADEQARQDAASGTAHGAFGQCDESAQNECPGWGSLDDVIDGCLQMMWSEGPGTDYSAHGHYINMTNEAYGEVACGFHETPDGAVWAVQDFR